MNTNNKSRLIRNLLRRLVLAVIAVIIGFQIYQWNAKSLIGEQMPMPFGYGMSVVLSGSMEPYLSVNDLVLIRETTDADEDIALGDVIVYESGGDLIIHRVIAKDGETIITQGDANNIADEPITPSAVRGRMVAHIPAVGALVRILKQPAAVVVLLALAIYLMEHSYRREREQDEEQLECIKAEIRRLKE